MSLYRIQLDGGSLFIEAPSYSTAVETWKKHFAEEWYVDLEMVEEPESVHKISDDPVIRFEPPF